MRNIAQKLSKSRFLFLCIVMLALSGCTKKNEAPVPEETDLFALTAGEETLPISDEETDEAPEDTPKPQVVVHVCGAVMNEGVYTLDSGGRVIDAVNAAGGFRDDAAASALNQAEVLSDGMKVKIPTVEEAEAIADSGGTEETADGRININTASAEELCAVNGIGPSRAADIVAYREQHGSFRTIEDIMKVSGIKQGLFAKIRDYIKV